MPGPLRANSLDMAIRSGIENPDSSIGFYAGDKESYHVFDPVLSPMIREIPSS